MPAPSLNLWPTVSHPNMRQLEARLRKAIVQGEIGPGTRLPAIRELAESLGVNRNTVARAYRELSRRGYLATRFGAGTYALLPTPEPEPTGPPAETAPAPRFLEAGWERRFARHPRGSFVPVSHAAQVGNGEDPPINFFQLRPYTDLFPLERFRECLNTVLERSGRRLLNYGTPAGYRPLREQIAKRLRARDIPAQAGQILITSGSQQGIDLLARAFLDSGDGVVVESPMYSIALRIFLFNGARVLPYSVRRDGVSYAALEQNAPQAPPKLFYAVPNFQNPTTHSYSVAEKQALLTHVRQAGSFLVEDASDWELHAETTPRPALAALDPSGRVIHLNTFSKTLVPALRAGYLMAPPAVVRRLTELKEMTDLSHSLILQAALAEFMERGDYEDHVAAVRSYYRRRMALATGLLAELLPPETPFSDPGGGLCVWVDLPPHVDTTRLYGDLRQVGVLISPGTLYQPISGERNGIRLCVATESEERLARGFHLLGQALRGILRRPPPGPREQEYQSVH